MDQGAFEVIDAFSIEGRGVVLAGTLVSGALKIGMKSMMSGKEISISSMEAENKVIQEFNVSGNKVGVLVTGIGKADVIKGNLIFQ